LKDVRAGVYVEYCKMLELMYMLNTARCYSWRVCWILKDVRAGVYVEYCKMLELMYMLNIARC